MKLRDVLPPDFFLEHFKVHARKAAYTGIHRPSAAAKFLDVEVVKTHDGYTDRFPGPARHCNKWWSLANGKAVGWNESPIRGWSFPVAKLPSHKRPPNA